MNTLREIVQCELDSRPLITGLFNNNLLNIHALAKYLRQPVQNTKGELVSVESIAMTIRRLKSEQQSNLKITLPVARTIQVQSDLSILTFQSNDAQHGAFNNSRFVCHTLGLKESILTISNEDIGDLSKIANRVQDNMSALVISLVNETSETVGAYAQIQLLLALEGIPVAEVSSVHNDLILIISSDYTERAFSVLRRLTH